MDVEAWIDYFSEKPHSTVETPFGPDTLVFKVKGKMFGLLPIDKPMSINLKNTPEKNVELCAEWDEIKPGYHMNKIHWVTVSLTGRLKASMIKTLIDESYSIVWKGLPLKLKIV